MNDKIFIEGSHPNQSLENIKKVYVKNGSKILEIGPYYNPRFIGDNVKYMDILSSIQMKYRAIRAGVEQINIDNIPFINYVRPDGKINNIKEKFDVVYSSHCIEHQFCPIKHINEVEKILNKNGRYIITVPDKRYCFDYFIRETTIADLLEAFYNDSNKHTLKSVIEHRALITHNSAIRHWEGDHGTPLYKENLDIIKKAVHDYNNNIEVDVHKWQFYPESFLNLYQEIHDLGYVNMDVRYIYDTPENQFEFHVILQKKLSLV